MTHLTSTDLLSSASRRASLSLRALSDDLIDVNPESSSSVQIQQYAVCDNHNS